MTKTAKLIARYILLVLALAMIIFGLFSGDMKAVFGKAAMICYECIGIG